MLRLPACFAVIRFRRTIGNFSDFLRLQASRRRQKDEKNGYYKTQHQAVSMLDPGDNARRLRVLAHDNH
ncbi:MAG: hypothetical protein WB769_17540 [Pseudolabrys sp.]